MVLEVLPHYVQFIHGGGAVEFKEIVDIHFSVIVFVELEENLLHTIVFHGAAFSGAARNKLSTSLIVHYSILGEFSEP